MKNVYHITLIFSFPPLLFQTLVTWIPKQHEAPRMPLVIYDGQTTSFVAKIRSWNQLNRNQLMNSERLTFRKTLPTVEWVQTREFNWRIPVPCMPWKSTKFLLHVQEHKDWGRYWLNSRTRPMILFSTLVRSPTVRSEISLLLFHCDHCLFRSVQVPESEEPHAK